jgi:tripartite-type tricarboxylate transporter receptor subunit TctC
MRKFLGTAAAVLGLLLLACAPAAAQSLEDFYRGKQVRLVIGFGAGSGFDGYARLVARHYPRHIPGNPAMLVQNMSGAGSLTALHYVLNTAPPDGTAIAMVNPTTAIDPLFHTEQANYDPRALAWIGSITADTTTCGFWTDRRVTLADLKRERFIVGGTALTGGTATADRVLKAMLGLNFQIVAGYKDLPELNQAAERGEVAGYCGVMASTLKASNLWDRFNEGKLQLPLQVALEKDPDLPADIPNAFDLVTSEEDRQILLLLVGPWYFGRPFTASPNVPPERLAALRSGFMATMRDADFLAEAKRLLLSIRPVAGEEIQRTIRDIYAISPAVLERAKPMFGIDGK